MRNAASPTLLRRIVALQALLLLLHTASTPWPPVAHGAEEAQPIGEQCSKDTDCQNPELVHCKEGICACRYGHHSPYLCKEAPVTQKPSEEGWPAVEDRECSTDHMCYRGYCWHGTCHCRDGFVKEKAVFGGWTCVHRTSSFGFGILAVIPVTVVVICLVACCVQVALRKQHQMPSNAAAAAAAAGAQPDLAGDNSNANMPAAGVSNIYRQRRYFPHYVESPKPHAAQQASPPTTSRPIEMKPIEAKETTADIEEADGSSSNHATTTPQA